jgi:hypothetical protein
VTTISFEHFLAQNKSRSVKLDGRRVNIFHPNFPVDEHQLEAAQTRLGIPLPGSYKTFLEVCGSGEWCGDHVVSPEDVYSFDEDCGDLNGFVALVHNVSGVGNFVAMNPHEQTGPQEWSLYYRSHDPFGLGKVGDSFESWAREAVVAFEETRNLYLPLRQAHGFRRTVKRGRTR